MRTVCSVLRTLPYFDDPKRDSVARRWSVRLSDDIWLKLHTTGICTQQNDKGVPSESTTRIRRYYCRRWIKSSTTCNLQCTASQTRPRIKASVLRESRKQTQMCLVLGKDMYWRRRPVKCLTIKQCFDTRIVLYLAFKETNIQYDEKPNASKIPRENNEIELIDRYR